MATGVAATAVLVASACGDGDKPLRDATVDDLPQMVLQSEDVPSDLRPLSGIPEDSALPFRPGLAQPGELQSIASYAAEFVLPPGEERQGAIACMASLFAFYASVDEAVVKLDRAAMAFRETAVTTPGVRLEELEAPNVGDEAVAFRLTSDVQSFCRLPETTSHASEYLFFRIGKNISAISLGNFNEAVDMDEITRFAEKQRDRIEGVLSFQPGENHGD